MAEDGNYKAQVSIKFGPSNQHMLNVRDAGMIEVSEEISAHGAILLATVEEFIAKAAVINAFPGTTQVAAGAAAPAQTQSTTGRTCAHGVQMEFREGLTRANKPYKAYFCRVENDPQIPKCPAVWLN